MKRMFKNQNKVQKKKKITSKPQSVVEQLAGSLKTSVPYMDHTVAREYAARELAKKYLMSISITQFRRRFSHYIQNVRGGEAIVITHRKYPNDHFVIRPHRSKTDVCVFAELIRL